MLLKRFHSVQSAAPATPAAVLADAALSEREGHVLKLLAQGYVNKEIAAKLGISPTTVGSHIKNLYRKLAAHSRVQVVRIAQQRGLL
jgi:DNA-binding CsgD family transcriptional regulator